MHTRITIKIHNKFTNTKNYIHKYDTKYIIPFVFYNYLHTKKKKNVTNLKEPNMIVKTVVTKYKINFSFHAYSTYTTSCNYTKNLIRSKNLVSPKTLYKRKTIFCKYQMFHEKLYHHKMNGTPFYTNVIASLHLRDIIFTYLVNQAFSVFVHSAY